MTAARLPARLARAHGDLYLRLGLHVPEHLSGAQKEAFERLRELEHEGEKEGRKPFWR